MAPHRIDIQRAPIITTSPATDATSPEPAGSALAQARAQGTRRAAVADRAASAGTGPRPVSDSDARSAPEQDHVAIEQPLDQPRWLTRDDQEVPARPALTRRRIVLTALRLVEEHGLDALTMRRVASALHVTPMSLYNHVSDKAELVDLLVDFLIGDVVAASAHDTGDWEARLRALTQRNHDMWRSHPGIIKVYADGVTMGPNGLANAERAVGMLREAGFSDEEAAGAFLLLYRWSMAGLLVGRTRPVSRHQELPKSPKSKEDRLRAYFAALPVEEIPNIEATVMFLSGTSIDFGLDIIMAGLKARLAEKSKTTANGSAGDGAQASGQPDVQPDRLGFRSAGQPNGAASATTPTGDGDAEPGG